MEYPALRQRLVDSLRENRDQAVLIFGPSLVGKTNLFDELQRQLSPRDPQAPFVKACTCSSVYAGYEPLLGAVEELSKKRNWARKQQAAALGIAIGGHGLISGIGLLKRFFPDAVPEEALDALKKALEASLKTSAEGSRLEFPRSDASKLQQHLERVVQKSGRRLILLVDRLDELSTPGIRLLQLIADTGARGVSIAMFVGSDSIAFGHRQDLREFINSLRKRDPNSVLELTGYCPQSLQQMRNLKGFNTTLAEAQRAFEYSLGGRIGLASPWIDEPGANTVALTGVADQLAAHFAIQYDKLTDSGRYLVKYLGAVFPKSLSLQHAAICLGCTSQELEGKLHQVAPFVIRSELGVSLAHRHALYFLRKKVGSDLVLAAFNDVAPRLGVLMPDPRVPVTTLVEKAKLEPPVALVSMDATTLFSLARDDLARGATVAAMNRIDAWRVWHSGAAGPSREVIADLSLLEADALGQLGAYDQAIELLEAADPELDKTAIEVALSLGEKYYRAGNHQQAKKHFSEARRGAAKAGLDDHKIRAAARTVSLWVEISSGARSGRLSLLLSKALSVVTIQPRSRALACRSIARSFVLSSQFQSRAEDFANEALRVATEETKSERDHGNALYALGDVQRHLGKLDDAVASFSRASAIAERTGNSDLEIYCLLAKAACCVADGNQKGLHSIVLELQAKCGSIDSPERKIAHLFHVALERLQGKSISRLDDGFAVPGRKWTHEIVTLLNGGSALAEGLRNLRIVL